MRGGLLAVTVLLLAGVPDTAHADFWVPQPVDVGAAGGGSKVVAITGFRSGDRVVIGTDGRNLNLTRPGENGLDFKRYKRHKAPAAITDLAVFSTLGDTVVIVLTLADGTYQVHHLRVSDGENLPGFPVPLKPVSGHGSRSAVILPDGQGYALGLGTDQSLQVASIGPRGQLTADPEIIAQGAAFTRLVAAKRDPWFAMAWEEVLADGSSRPGAALRIGDVWQPAPIGETDRRVQGRPALFSDTAGSPTVAFSTWDGATGLTAFARTGDPSTGAWGSTWRLSSAPGDCCFSPVGRPSLAARLAGRSPLVGAVFDGAGFKTVVRSENGTLTTLGDAGGAFPHPVGTLFGGRNAMAMAWIAQSRRGMRVAGGGLQGRVLNSTLYGRGVPEIDGLNISSDGRGNGIAAWREVVGGLHRPAAAVFDAVRPRPEIVRAKGSQRDFLTTCGAQEQLGCEASFAVFRPGSTHAARTVRFAFGDGQVRRVRLSDATLTTLLGRRDSGPAVIELDVTDRAGNAATARRTFTVRR